MICRVFFSSGHRFRRLPNRDKFPNVERFFVEASYCLKGVELPPVGPSEQSGNIHETICIYIIYIYISYFSNIYMCIYKHMCYAHQHLLYIMHCIMFIHTYMAAPFDGSCFGIRAILTRTFIDFNQLPKSIQRGAILIHMNPS